MSANVFAQYHSAVGRDHRQKFGQFFTPMPVARFMCRWLFERGIKEVFDPAFGLGAFYQAATEFDSEVRFYGCEKDPTIIAHFKEHYPTDNTSKFLLTNADYFTIWGGKYSAIICNPPYMRFQNFRERHSVLPELESRLGIRLSGYTNIASAFLLKSLSELAPGGCLSYLMPLEFLNTGYGEAVKRSLLHKKRLKALLRIEPETEVFPDAITSVGIVLVSDDAKHESVTFCTVQTLDQLAHSLSELPSRSVPMDLLRPSDKWLPHFEEQRVLNHQVLQPLSLYGSFSRGIATGANEFFLMSKSEAASRELPLSIFRPCISRSSQIRQPLLSNAEIDHLIESDERVLLVDLSASQMESVKEYIAFGVSQGFDKRYLTRTRKPWFKLETRRSAPILFGVFSRGGFKVVRNTSRAVSLTCFHCFCPNLFGVRFLDHLFLYFCSSSGQRIISSEVRKYGDKLDKFEPNDLNRAMVPSPEWLSGLSDDDVTKLSACSSFGGVSSHIDRLFDQLVT